MSLSCNSPRFISKIIIKRAKMNTIFILLLNIFKSFIICIKILNVVEKAKYGKDRYNKLSPSKSDNLVLYFMYICIIVCKQKYCIVFLFTQNLVWKLTWNFEIICFKNFSIILYILCVLYCYVFFISGVIKYWCLKIWNFTFLKCN